MKALIRPLLLCLCLVASLSAQTEKADDHGVRLIEACRTGDLVVIQAELARGADINQTDTSNFTPLMHALDARQGAAARLLIERGANVNADPGWREWPIHFAIHSDDPALLEFLIQRGAEVNPDSYGWTPSREALVWADADILRVLQKHGADLQHFSEFDMNALTTAAMYNNLTGAKYLLELGMDVNRPAPDGNYPLAVAAMESHVDMVKLLLAAGADPNAISTGEMNVNGNPREQHTALVAAVRDNNLETVNVLLAAGADPTLLDNLALRYADVSGNLAIYQRLLGAGAKDLPPYSFTDIKILRPNWAKDPNAATRATPVDWANLSVMNNHAADKSPPAAYAGPPITVAVLAGEALQPAELLVTADLSSQANIQLVERNQLQKALDEWSLARSGFTDVEQSVRMGQLAGADCLVTLSQSGDLREAKIVSTATGLVLQVIPAGKDLDQWATEIANEVVRNAPMLHAGADGLKLVSIPLITSTRADVIAIDQDRAMSQALGMYLGAIDGVYVLDRRDMTQLAGEKLLTDDARKFFGSGWLIDGSYDVSGDSLTITLRLRQTGSGEEQIIKATSKLSNPQPALAELSAKVAEALGAAVGEARSAGEEGALYQAEAERAYELKQWDATQQAADAAWVLGNHSDAVQSLRLRSRIQRIRTARILIDQKVDKLSGPARVLAYRAPLLLEVFDSRELTASQYLALSNDILALYRPIVAKPNDHSASELDLLMAYPDALKAAEMPLELLHDVSDEMAHQAALTKLRAELLATTQAVLKIARENQYPYLYMLTDIAYMQCLPYLIRDEPALFAEIEKQLREASAMDDPYSKHTIFRAMENIMDDKMNKIGGQAGTSWQRLAARLMTSDNRDMRLLGLEMYRNDTSDYAGAVQASREIAVLSIEALREDTSLFGACLWYRPEISEEIAGEGSFQVYPEHAMAGIFSPDPYDLHLGATGMTVGEFRTQWYPRVDGGGQPERRFFPAYRDLRRERMRVRLETMAQSGSGAVNPSGVHDNLALFNVEELETLKVLAAQAQAKNLERINGRPEWERTAYRFNSYVVRPVDEVLAKKREEARPKENMVFKLPPFQMPLLLPGNPDDKDERDGARFNSSGMIPTDTGFWVVDYYTGFFHYNIAKQAIDRSVFLPTKTWCKSAFIDDRYIAVWFNVGGYKPRGIPRKTDIGVYDLAADTWRFYQPERIPDLERPDSFNLGVHNIVVLEDYLYYSFMSHPAPEGMKQKEVENDSRTSIGISRINLKTGEESLLVSGRRTPAESPLDNKKAYKTVAISKTELATNRMIYDETTGEWTKAPPTAKALEISPSAPHMRTDNFTVNDTYDKETGQLVLKAYSGKKAIKVEANPVYLQLDLSSWNSLKIPAEFEQMQRSYNDQQKQPDFRLYSHEHGFILFNSVGFYFISRESVLPLVEAAIISITNTDA